MTIREQRDWLIDGIALYLDDSDAIDAPAYFAYVLDLARRATVDAHTGEPS